MLLKPLEIPRSKILRFLRHRRARILLAISALLVTNFALLARSNSLNEENIRAVLEQGWLPNTKELSLESGHFYECITQEKSFEIYLAENHLVYSASDVFNQEENPHCTAIPSPSFNQEIL